MNGRITVMILRNYQSEAIVKMNEMENGESKICYIATGGGKTVIFSSYASTCKGRVVVIIDQTELREQSVDKLSVFVPREEIGEIQGAINEFDKRVTVATRQSLTHAKSDRMDKLLANGEIDTLIIDECHLALEQQKKIIKKLNPRVVVGFTASPFTVGINNVYDGFLYTKDMYSLIKENYLCSPRAFVCKTNVSLDGISSCAGDFNSKELDERINTQGRNRLIVEKFLEVGTDRNSVLAFCSSIDMAEKLRDEFRKAKVSCECVDSTLDEDTRKDILDRFREGKIRVLTNVNILTKGIDIPRIDCVVCATPTKSKNRYIQQIGRGARPFEGKNDFLVLDISDNYKKHNLLDCCSLFDVENGETVQEREERKEREARDEAERKRLEEERIAKAIAEEQERLRIEMEEINLFNRDMFNITKNSTMDWFYNTITKNGIEYKVAILTGSMHKDYYVIKVSAKEFKVYEVSNLKTPKGYKNIMREVAEYDSLKDAYEDAENRSSRYGSNYTRRNASWKREYATEPQIRACKNSSYVKTKWDAHKFMRKRSCYFNIMNDSEL